MRGIAARRWLLRRNSCYRFFGSFYVLIWKFSCEAVKLKSGYFIHTKLLRKPFPRVFLSQLAGANFKCAFVELLDTLNFVTLRFSTLFLFLALRLLEAIDWRFDRHLARDEFSNLGIFWQLSEKYCRKVLYLRNICAILDKRQTYLIIYRFKSVR